MSQIAVNRLTYCYEGSFDPVFEQVTLTLDTSWKLGLIGRNGRGKTTFLKLLCGELDAHGAISACAEFEYFPYLVSDPSKTGQELFEQIAPGAQDWEIFRELSLLDVSAEALFRPFDTLSSGEQTKLLLACMFLRENAFLLIDEPTNHLDAPARDAVERYLKRKNGFILVSHDRSLLDSCVDHILSINRLSIDLEQGNYTSWEQNRERREQYERGENERLEREIRRLSETAARAGAWAQQTESAKKGSRISGLRPDRGYIGHKSAKMMKRAKAVQSRAQQAAEQRRLLLREVEETALLTLPALRPVHSLVAECRDLAVCYGQTPVFEGMSFQVLRGERVALTGANGCGKSSVLKLLAGMQVPHSGLIRLAGGITVSYLPQDTSCLKGELRAFLQKHGFEEPLFKAILRKLSFERDQFEKPMEEFSEGQKKKVLLTASLCTPAHLYIWDEPLNYIDLPSREQIEQLLKTGTQTMVFVEHDRAFRAAVATKEILFE